MGGTPRNPVHAQYKKKRPIVTIAVPTRLLVRAVSILQHETFSSARRKCSEDNVPCYLRKFLYFTIFLPLDSFSVSTDPPPSLPQGPSSWSYLLRDFGLAEEPGLGPEDGEVFRGTEYGG